MRLPVIFRISGKEILATLRERRVLIMVIVMPLVIFPLLMMGFPLLVTGLIGKDAETTTDVAVHGLDNLPEDLRLHLEANKLEFTPHDDPFQAVYDDEFILGLRVPDDFINHIAKHNAELVIISKASNLRSSLNADKVRIAIHDFNQEYARQQLIAANLDSNILSAIHIETEDAATEAEEKSGQMGWMILYALSLLTFMGGQMIAVDTTAGEKERGTLEILLVSPVSRLEVVLGKFMTVFTFGFATAVMSVLGFILSASLSPMGGTLSLNTHVLVPFIISALLLATLTSVLLLSITMFARNIKEAQSYTMPFTFLILIPALLLMSADFLDFGIIVNFIPLMNIIWFMNDVMQGQVSIPSMLLTWGSTLILIAFLFYLSWRNFKREGVIFRN